MPNKTGLALPLGVSVPTIGEWLQVLEATGQIILVPPYFENFGKRLIKSPKVYWGDSGLACYLLGLTSAAELERSPFLGSLFEGFVASEILKSQSNQGMRKELYYFRDQQGLEVDFLVPRPNASLWLVEAKATKTVRPAMAFSSAFPETIFGQAVGAVNRRSPKVPVTTGHRGARTRGRGRRRGGLCGGTQSRQVTEQSRRASPALGSIFVIAHTCLVIDHYFCNRRYQWKKFPFLSSRLSVLPCWNVYRKPRSLFGSRASVSPSPRSYRIRRILDKASEIGSIRETLQILGDIVVPVVDETDIKEQRD